MSTIDAGTSRGFRSLHTDSYGCERETVTTIVDERTAHGLPCILTRQDAYWRRGVYSFDSDEYVEPDGWEDKFVGWVYAPEVETPLAGYCGTRPIRETYGGWVGFAKPLRKLGHHGKDPEEQVSRKLDRFAKWLRRHSEWNVCDCDRPMHNATEPHADDCATRTTYWYPERPEPWGEHVSIASLPGWIGANRRGE